MAVRLNVMEWMDDGARPMETDSGDARMWEEVALFVEDRGSSLDAQQSIAKMNLVATESRWTKTIVGVEYTCRNAR